MSRGTTPNPDHEHDPTTANPFDPAALPRIEGVTLKGVIARGGMGVVYRGVQEYFDRQVAVKVLASDLQNDDFIARFQREARILSGIQHPNIVLCYQAGMTDGGLCYMVMEFVDGPTLRQHTDAEGPLSPADAVAVCRDLARALEHARGAGVIHRDVKPDNVLLQPSTRVARGDPFPYVAKLVDLGIARTSQVPDGLTAPGMVIGTHSTMAPEQFDDPDRVDFRADIYGLGCVLYHALTGKPAFPNSPLTKVMELKRQALGPDPRQRVAAIPGGTAELTRRMMAASRKERPGSYQAIIAACEKQLAGSTAVSTGTKPSGPGTTITRLSLRDAPWAKGRRRPVLVALATALPLLLLAMLLIWRPWRGAAPAPGDGGPGQSQPNVPPTVSIAAPETVPVGGTLRLEAEVVDPDDENVTCEWKQVVGPTVAISAADRMLTVSPVVLLPETDLSFAFTVADGTNDTVIKRVDVRVVAGGESLFPKDTSQPLDGWELGASGSWSAYAEHVINVLANSGETVLQHELPADGFAVTGEIELMPEYGEDFAEAAGLRFLTPGQDSLVLWIESKGKEVSAAYGGQGEGAGWPPQAMGARTQKADDSDPILRFAAIFADRRITLVWNVGGASRVTTLERPEGQCCLQLFVREGLGRFYDLRLFEQPQ